MELNRERSNKYPMQIAYTRHQEEDKKNESQTHDNPSQYHDQSNDETSQEIMSVRSDLRAAVESEDSQDSHARPSLSLLVTRD